jgi:hypothetical protein
VIVPLSIFVATMSFSFGSCYHSLSLSLSLSLSPQPQDSIAPNKVSHGEP